MSDSKSREDMAITIVGHVDHGKSTIIGRLMADTNSLPEGKLEQVKENCRRNSKPFEYAFLLDALKDEQAQGITIDAARCFFKTNLRDYIILDSPGHIEFLKNMVTGASRAEAALLVIDAKEGVQENSTRHGYLLSMLGINQISVIVNKMDLVDYDEKVFKNIIREYSEFLNKIDVTPTSFIPVSGLKGDNVANKSENMPWYKGKTVLQQLDEFKNAKPLTQSPFRMPVQGVYKFTNQDDSRRIIAGTIESGKISVGDEIVFYPSGKQTKVKSIEAFNADKPKSQSAGYACGFTMTDQIYITRGEIAVKSDEFKPQVSSRMRTNIFWLGKVPLTLGKKYLLKLGTAKIGMKVEKIERVMNASTLNNEEKTEVERNEVAECILALDKVIAFDIAKDLASTSRFVIVDNYEIAGGGIVGEALEDQQEWVREKVITRNTKWEKSIISRERRAEKYNQKSSLIIVAGAKGSGKKEVAKELESKLLEDGKFVYYMGMSNILYGVDADIKIPNNQINRQEQIRRMAEVANLMMDAGMILIINLCDLDKNEIDLINTVIDIDNIKIVCIGEEQVIDSCDLCIPKLENKNEVIDKIKSMLQEEGVIFKPY